MENINARTQVLISVLTIVVSIITATWNTSQTSANLVNEIKNNQNEIAKLKIDVYPKSLAVLQVAELQKDIERLEGQVNMCIVPN